MTTGISATFADSPITSTQIYKSYLDCPMVVKAQETGVMNDTIAAFLLNDTIDIGFKVAVVNALSWDKGKKNANLLIPYILKKYGLSNGFDMNTLSGADILCLGYLSIMDDYFNPDKAISILKVAREKNPLSYTFNIILALAESQKAMDNDWCSVYKTCDEVRNNKSLRQDMRQGAIDNIFQYIDLYKEDCKTKQTDH